MEKLILPLYMYKETGDRRKGTKKESYVLPSWNHLYTIVNNQPILGKWALEHKEKIKYIGMSWKNKNKWKMTVDQKVIMKAKIFWGSARKSDPHNLDKLILDALEEANLYDDDCNVLLQYIDFDIDLNNPRIEIELEKGDLFDRNAIVDTQRKVIKETKKENERKQKEKIKERIILDLSKKIQNNVSITTDFVMSAYNLKKTVANRYIKEAKKRID